MAETERKLIISKSLMFTAGLVLSLIAFFVFSLQFIYSAEVGGGIGINIIVADDEDNSTINQTQTSVNNSENSTNQIIVNTFSDDNSADNDDSSSDTRTNTNNYNENSSTNSAFDSFSENNSTLVLISDSSKSLYTKKANFSDKTLLGIMLPINLVLFASFICLIFMLKKNNLNTKNK